MKVTLAILAIVCGLVVVIVAIGYLLPIQHVASRSTQLNSDPGRIWSAINEFKLADDDLTYLTLESIPQKKLVRKIADAGLPFGGTWTFEIDGSSLTITENGEVYNPVFRFVSRFIIGHYATLDKYLAQLKVHLEAKPS